MSTQLDLAVRGTRAHDGPTRAQQLKTGSRAALLWVVAIAVVLIAAITVFFVSITNEETRPLHPDSVQPDGTKAAMEILRDRGVDVTATESRAEALRLAGRPDTTVLIADPDRDADSETNGAIGNAVRKAKNSLVLINPGHTAGDFTRAMDQASLNDISAENTTLNPDCRLPAAEAAGPVHGALTFYAANHGYQDRVHTCYTIPGLPPHTGALARAEDNGADITALGSPDWITNAALDEEGHAALIMHTLGAHPKLVYYLPQPGDQPSAAHDDGPSSAELIPGWFGVAMLWLIPVTAALFWWRVRRFGPLAIERLPVVVPPVETVHGRAALLQRAGARTDALHSLRTASMLRIAARLARPAQERPEQLCAAIADHTGRELSAVRYAYLDGVPRTDRQLSELAVLITAIESEVSPT